MTSEGAGPPKSGEYYRSPEAVETLSGWYRLHKETAFLDHVLRRLPLAPSGLVIEIGGGAGVHGELLQREFGDRYVHSDYSPELVERAKSRGLQSRVVDGLSMPFENSSVAIEFLVGTSTIIRDQATREQQFRECHRTLATGGVAVFVFTRVGWRGGLRALTKADREVLRREGFTNVRSGSWGVIPRRLWRGPIVPLVRRAEAIVASCNLGVRGFVIAQKA